MNPKAFDERVPRDPADLKPVVKLMTQPDAGGSFVSAVDFGANGREFVVVKSADGDLGTRGGWFRRLIGATFAWVTKSDDPVTFDAAIAIPQIHEQIWQAQDALRLVIWNIVENPELPDREALIRSALDAFGQHIAQVIRPVLVAKAEDSAAIVEAVRKLAAGGPGGAEIASKAGRVLSGANTKVIDAAMTQMQEALDALTAMREAADASTATKAGDPPADQEADVLKFDQAQVTIAAKAAAEAAVVAAKAANPNATPGELASAAAAASTEVFKAAVMGAPQPAVPSNALAAQLAGQATAPGSDPFAAITSTLASIKATVSKLDETVTKLDAQVIGTDEAPGVIAVVGKHAEILETVAKRLGTPKPPVSAPVATGGGTAEGEPTTVSKGDDVFQGSALGGFGGR